MRWFISDTHFGHKNIIEYGERPFKDLAEMHQALIDNWNSRVQPSDTVYFLGDFGMAPKDDLFKICDQLNGKLVCILGNHDGSEKRMRDIGFDVALYGATIRIQGQWVNLKHIPPQYPPDTLTIHGHVHQHLPFGIFHNRLNVSVEVTNYLPVSEDQVASLMVKATVKMGGLYQMGTQTVPSNLPINLVKVGERLDPLTSCKEYTDNHT